MKRLLFAVSLVLLFFLAAPFAEEASPLEFSMMVTDAEAVCPVIPIRCDPECSDSSPWTGQGPSNAQCWVCYWGNPDTCTNQICNSWMC